jgi:hypothetical protein
MRSFIAGVSAGFSGSVVEVSSVRGRAGDSAAVGMVFVWATAPAKQRSRKNEVIAFIRMPRNSCDVIHASLFKGIQA